MEANLPKSIQSAGLVPVGGDGTGLAESFAATETDPTWLGWAPLVLAAGLLGFLAWASWGAALVGPDEGMEFAKGLLLKLRPDLAAVAWNDQPWFFSQVLALLGGSAEAGRILVALVTLGVVWAVGRMVLASGSQRLRGSAAPPVSAQWFLAVVFLLSWPWVAQLSVSAMCEWPAFCLAIIAYAVLPKRAEEWSMSRFAVAGGLLAVAVQIKLTALILGPALAADVAVRFWRDGVKVGRRCSAAVDSSGEQSSEELVGAARQHRPTGMGDGLEALSYLGAAMLAFAVGFGGLILWSPAWNWSQLWGSHVVAGGVKDAAAHGFHPWDWVKDTPGTCLAAVCGVWMYWRAGRRLELVFPLVLLGTALAVHWVHRPFWYYYGVHFGVPLSILAAMGVTGLIGVFFGPSSEDRQTALAPSQEGISPTPSLSEEGGGVVAASASNLPGREARPTGNRQELALMLGVLCIAIWFGFEGQRFVSQVHGVISAQKVADNEMIATLKEYRGRVKWAYSRSNEPLFHAGFLQPPELTILSKKRFWSGNMTEDGVLDAVNKYDCEVLLLLDGIELKNEKWKKLTAERYVNVLSSGGATLFVAKRLDPKPKTNNTLELLKKLGL